jgi:hypothetical protein
MPAGGEGGGAARGRRETRVRGKEVSVKIQIFEIGNWVLTIHDK